MNIFLISFFSLLFSSIIAFLFTLGVDRSKRKKGFLVFSIMVILFFLYFSYPRLNANEDIFQNIQSSIGFVIEEKNNESEDEIYWRMRMNQENELGIRHLKNISKIMYKYVKEKNKIEAALEFIGAEICSGFRFYGIAGMVMLTVEYAKYINQKSDEIDYEFTLALRSFDTADEYAEKLGYFTRRKMKTFWDKTVNKIGNWLTEESAELYISQGKNHDSDQPVPYFTFNKNKKNDCELDPRNVKHGPIGFIGNKKYAN